MSTTSAKLQRRVYLSGGMEYAHQDGKEWRLLMQEWLEDELCHSVFNPSAESARFFAARYPGIDFRRLKNVDMTLFQEIVRQLVEIDCTEIAERSDYIICLWDESAQRGAGTKGELTLARHFGKPVYMVTTMPMEEIPGWVLGCTTHIFESFDTLKEEMRRLFPPLAGS